MAKPRVGIFGLTGCAGDQLQIINCEDELLAVVSAVDLKSFVMAQTGNDESEFDISFVEGSVVTEEDEARLKEIRNKSGLLIAIGTCACWGGVQAAANDAERKELYEAVYGTPDDLYAVLPKVKALNEVVQVDWYISGCPIEKDQFLSSVVSLLHGDLPIPVAYPVCYECKRKENPCRLVEKGELCMGSLTIGGCGGRCPSHNTPCKGCRGPVEEANIASEYEILLEKGYSRDDLVRAFRTFGWFGAVPEMKAGDSK